ncbi:MAG: phosphate signaling complex protein PhoU [candidate division Zixibacteria bacterium]|nr:phosphate signaling complex protein PhoU [candidate division Zixibacteria bacterium]
MTMYFQREIELLKKKILTLGALVEENLRRAVKSIQTRDTVLAQQAIENDTAIDDMEVEVEEDCLKILALHQPVAIDLRFIIAVLKINSDLERIGDLAVNLAERSVFLSTREPLKLPFDLSRMAELAQSMLRNSLDALVNLDRHLAQEVCKTDDEIDAMHRLSYGLIEEAIKTNPKQMDLLISSLALSRNLERVADHTTNIAEDVLYMIQGEIVRHRLG